MSEKLLEMSEITKVLYKLHIYGIINVNKVLIFVNCTQREQNFVGISQK